MIPITTIECSGSVLRDTTDKVLAGIQVMTLADNIAISGISTKGNQLYTGFTMNKQDACQVAKAILKQCRTDRPYLH